MSRFGVASPGYPQAPPATITPLPAPAPRRRRWPWVLGSIIVTAGVVGAGAYWFGRRSVPKPLPPPPPPATVNVLALAKALPAGYPIVPGDLETITVQPGGSKDTSGLLTPGAEASVVGKELRTPLPAGVLLTSADLTTEAVPAAGYALVGFDLKPSEAPTGTALVAGDRVGILYVPAAQQPPYPAPQPLVAAQVWAATPGAQGDTDVVVQAPTSLSAQLAAYAQHDEIALVRLTADQTWPLTSPPTTSAPVSTTPPTTSKATKTKG
jgi:hypothetical protein